MTSFESIRSQLEKQGPKVESVADILKRVTAKIPRPFDETTTPVPEKLRSTWDYSAQLFQQQQYQDGIIRSAIAAFDNWIFNILPHQIANRTIKLKEGSIHFPAESVKMIPPSFSYPDKSVGPDYPNLCRAYDRTYYGELSVEPVYIRPSSRPGKPDVVEKLDRFVIGHIPIMLGSQLDNLTGKTGEELLRYEECINNPKGYFIVEGKEDLILYQEKLRANKPIVYFDPKGLTPLIKITNSTISGTTQITIRYMKTTNSTGKAFKIPIKTFQVSTTPLDADKYISIFSLFRILGIDDIGEATQMILNFVNPEYHDEARQILITSQTQAQNIGTTFSDDIKAAMDAQAIGARQLASNASIDDIRALFIKGFSPEATQWEKQQLLAMLCGSIVSYTLGIRLEDGRDSWSNKRLIGSAKTFEEHFGSCWKIHTAMMERTAQELSIAKPNTVLNRFPRNAVTDAFVNAFRTKKWEFGKKTKGEISDTLSTLSLLSAYNHLCKVTIPQKGSRQSKSMAIRDVQQSQLGYICPAHTVDGASCGITKHLAQGCIVALPYQIPPALMEVMIADLIKEAPNEVYSYPLIINGIFKGWARREKYDQLLHLRREGILTRQACVVFDTTDKLIAVYTDGNRLIRPLLIVDTDGKLIIEKKNLWTAPYDVLIQEQCAEYVDAYEQEFVNLAESIDALEMHRVTKIRIKKYLRELTELHEKGVAYATLENEQGIKVEIEDISEELNRVSVLSQKKIWNHQYTHCELDPQSILSYGVNSMPFPGTNPAARQTYQANMGAQSIGIYSTQYHRRMDTSSKVMVAPSMTSVMTEADELMGTTLNATGEDVLIAISPFFGGNQEDSIVINQASIDKGLFQTIKYYTIKVPLMTGEKMKKPQLAPGENPTKYVNLNKNGLPYIGTKIGPGDVIMGRVRIKDGEETVANVYTELTQEGEVETVNVSTNRAGETVVRIKLKKIHTPEPGDKLAARYSQKGTISRIIPEVDMPMLLDGRKPDIIFNPLGFPSRMTIGMLIEVLFGNVASYSGMFFRSRAFRPNNIYAAMRALTTEGFKTGSLMTLVEGTRGRYFQANVGYVKYLPLKHQVSDKMQHRATGPIDASNRQPTKGRRSGGAIRAGEMERDAMITHGASGFLSDRLFRSSDPYSIIVCRKCKTPATSHIVGFTSCRLCGARDDEGLFVKVPIPYSLKRLNAIIAALQIRVYIDVKT